MSSMAEVVVLGGSVAGLSTALMLQKRGHRVVVLERDEPSPDDKDAAAVEWQRPSTPQLRQSHACPARGVHIMRAELPDVVEDLVQHEAHLLSAQDMLPASVADREPRPGDEDLVSLCFRRPVLDWALTRAARRAGVRRVRTLARGLQMEGRRVVGVETDEETFAGDVVVDAAGRLTKVPRWLAAAGIHVETTRSPSGCVYLTRTYSLAGAAAPAPFAVGFATAGPVDGFVGLVFRGDADTFTVSLQVDEHDRDLLVARDPAAFTATCSLVPWLAPWVAAGTPLTDVAVMAGLDNTSRRLVKDGQPLVAGLLQVGDSAATTNPTLGRGMSLALVGAGLLCDVLESTSDLDERAVHLAAARGTQIDPFVEEAWGSDERMVAQIRARLYGESLAAKPAHPLPEEVLPFTMTDRDAWTRHARKNHVLELPATLYADPVLAERVLAARAIPMQQPPPPVTHEECLAAARDACGANA